LLEFAERCLADPEKAENVLLGKDEAGNEVRRSYSKEELVEMKVKSDRILRNAVPAKAQYLQQRAVLDQDARRIHPELYDENSEIHQEAVLIVSQCPEIMRFPDFPIWIGDAIKGRNARLAEEAAAKNGADGKVGADGKPLSAATKALLNAPKLKPAPGIPKNRSVTGSERLGSGRDVDVEEARKELSKHRGSDDAMEKFIAAKLGAKRNRTGGREPVLA
jgi:hypothetical protein